MGIIIIASIIIIFTAGFAIGYIFARWQVRVVRSFVDADKLADNVAAGKPFVGLPSPIVGFRERVDRAKGE